MMKGITNAELRQKLEHIEDELRRFSQAKEPERKSTSNGSFLGISTICALSATVAYVLTEHPVLLFFMITSIASMAFFVFKMGFDKRK